MKKQEPIDGQHCVECAILFRPQSCLFCHANVTVFWSTLEPS